VVIREVGDRRSRACCRMAMGTLGLTGSVVAEKRKIKGKMDTGGFGEMTLSRSAGYRVLCRWDSEDGVEI
jgi:hypothetical protein